MSLTSIQKGIISGIKKNADPKGAEERKMFHRGYSVKEYGLMNPVLHAIQKSYKKEIKELTCTEAFKLAENLYKGRSEEEVSSGTYVLSVRTDCFSKQNVAKKLDHFSKYLLSWSTTDAFCSELLQPLFMQYPREILPILKKWNSSKDIWQRRASVVAFTRKVGESGRFTNDALKLCAKLINDKEDLIQKAVGWCLKDIMRGEKERVLEYVRKLRKQKASAVITLYAIRDLKGKERQKILAIK